MRDSLHCLNWKGVQLAVLQQEDQISMVCCSVLCNLGSGFCAAWYCVMWDLVPCVIDFSPDLLPGTQSAVNVDHACSAQLRVVRSFGSGYLSVRDGLCNHSRCTLEVFLYLGASENQIWEH